MTDTWRDPHDWLYHGISNNQQVVSCRRCGKYDSYWLYGVKPQPPRSECVSKNSKISKCGQDCGENTFYWPCPLPKDHGGPHSWHPGRREWELEQELAPLRAANSQESPS